MIDKPPPGKVCLFLSNAYIEMLKSWGEEVEVLTVFQVSGYATALVSTEAMMMLRVIDVCEGKRT